MYDHLRKVIIDQSESLPRDTAHLVIYTGVCIYSGILTLTPRLDNCFSLLWYRQVEPMYT
jgi:hypothetical protein